VIGYTAGVKLVLVRHGRAQERALLQRDRTRELTPEGRRRMRKAGVGLQTLVPGLAVLATSPLVRAQQTAELIARAYGGGLDITELPSLVPGEPMNAILAWLREQPADVTLALVGHEPDLGRLGSWLLSGKKTGFLQFKKGAAALIEFSGAPAAGNGSLVWLLTAAQLAKVAT